MFDGDRADIAIGVHIEQRVFVEVAGFSDRPVLKLHLSGRFRIASKCAARRLQRPVMP
jgi:hypothetical protein